jgi:hypothetical protein
MTTTTNTGVADTETVTGPLDEHDATDAFFSRLFPEGGNEDASKKKPSENEGENDTTPESDNEEPEQEAEDSDESPEDEADGDGEAEAEEKADKKFVDGDDTTFVKIKVGEEEHEVPVKDLKRLFGQESALTKKSQEVAEQRKAVEAEQTAYGMRLKALQDRAKARADEFRKVNWLALTKDPNVPADQLAILQQEAQKALDEENFLNAETNAFVQHVQGQQRATLAKQAAETVKVLGDQTSPLYIEGWNQKMYDDMRTFATGQGVPAEIVNQITEAPILKLLHMAMQFQRGAQKVQTIKKDKTPKKIVKTSSAPAARDTTSSKATRKKAVDRLRSSGSEEDAISAFMTGMSAGDNE